MTKDLPARLSFDLPDENSALHLARRIADASGRAVTVVTAEGDDLARIEPQSETTDEGARTIASLRKLADGMISKTKH